MDRNAALNLDRDMAFVLAMVDDLKNYLLADDLYWNLGTKRGYTLPTGTLGGLFLRLHRLRTFSDQLTAEDRARLDKATQATEKGLDRWLAQTEQKVEREANARLNGWKTYLNELANELKQYAGEYPTQAEGRTILDLLLEYSSSFIDSAIRTQLSGADQKLRSLTKDSDFIWGEDMQAAFPQDRFWWLYVTPRYPENA